MKTLDEAVFKNVAEERGRGLWIAEYGLRIADYGIRITDYGLQNTDCGYCEKQVSVG